MLSRRQKEFIYRHAYLPEQLPWYLGPMGDMSAHLNRPFILYERTRALSCIGYPLGEDYHPDVFRRCLRDAMSAFEVDWVQVIVPEPPAALPGVVETGPRDDYWFLELDRLPPPPKVMNMVRRAEREVEVRLGWSMGRRHRALLGEFCRRRHLEPEMGGFLQRMPGYVNRCFTAYPLEAWRGRPDLWPGRFGREGSTVRLMEAWRGESLLAFNVMELGAERWGFYLFSVSGDAARKIPGISDLLLHRLLLRAREEGKSFVNLGLGINEGIRAFKRKWGAEPLRPYYFALLRPGTA
jgi:hypothetical protein